MSLRARTLLLVGLILLGLIVLMYIFTRVILLNSFSDLERADTREQVRRVQEALAEESVSLSAVAGDWAPWTDTYDFVQGGYDAYVDDNMMDSTFANLQVNFMIFLNDSAEIVYAKNYDLQNEVEVAVSDELRAWLVAGNPMLEHEAVDSATTGIVLMPEAPLMVASRSIVTSDYESPVGGTLVVGSYLNEAKWAAVSEHTRLALSIWRLDLPPLSPDAHVQRALEALPEEDAVYVRALDGQTIAGYFVLNDTSGRPAILVRVDRPRSIHERGQDTLRYLIASITITGLVFGVAIMLLLETSILRRLGTLTRHVTGIGHSRDRSARIPALTGQDELSQLATAINATLAALEKSETDLQRSNMLLKEIHHRVRNNLQVVSSLLTLQTGRTQDEGTGQLLRDGQNRIQMIALVHEKLYNSDDPSLIDLSEYTRSLVERLRSTLVRSDVIRINVSADPVVLSADRAVSVGLILNELISNAFKHAFPGERTGEIGVELRSMGEEQYLIRVRDDGVGVPEGLDITKTSSLGLQLVHGLAKQLNGTVELRRDGGTIFEVKFAGVSGDKGNGSG